MRNFALKIRYILLFILQILDGLFTYLGVQKFRTINVEGNPIVHYVMSQLGPAEGLITIKLIACLFLVILFYQTMKDTIRIKLFPRCLDFFILLYSVVVWTWFELLFMETQPIGNFISHVIHSIL